MALVRVKGRDENGRRLRWVEADTLVTEVVTEVTQGQKGDKGDKGEPGRSSQVFETLTEPVQAQAGDFWVIGD